MFRDFGQIWKAPEFPDYTHDILLTILEKFEILIPMPGKKNENVNRYLIPYLVNSEKPKEIGELIRDERFLVRRRYVFGMKRHVTTNKQDFFPLDFSPD